MTEERLTAITGGTDAGVFALFGSALGEDSRTVSIGVAPAGNDRADDPKAIVENGRLSFIDANEGPTSLREPLRGGVLVAE